VFVCLLGFPAVTAAQFKPGDEVSYSAGGSARVGLVLAKAGGRDLYLVSRNGAESTQYHLPASRLTLRTAGPAPPPDPLTQRVSQLEQQVQQLGTRLGGAEGTLGTLGDDLADLAVRVAALEGEQPPPPPPPPVDSDDDGVPDSEDECPNDPDPCDPPPPPPADEPAPIAGQGYHQAFRDDFDAFSTARWTQGIWYSPSVPANGVSVQNGVLNLVSRRSQGYPNVTVTTQGGWGGAAPAKFRRGYFEARMRWTKGNGSWPAFWLISYAHATNPNWPSPACPQPTCLSAELDVFEGQGREPSVYYGTSHRNSCGCYGVPNQQNGNNSTNVGFDLTTGFHTYGMLWTATQIRWYLDGQLLKTTPVYDSTDQEMFLLLQMWIGGWTGGTDASTPDELRTEVDWVRVWQQ
jgi:Glycosyl hydrolases family 16